MFASLTGGGKGGEEALEFVWNDTVKMKTVFAEPQLINSTPERVWKYETAIFWLLHSDAVEPSSLSLARRYIFSDMSAFLNNYHKYRGDSNLVVSEWQHVEKINGTCNCLRHVEAHIAIPTLYVHYLEPTLITTPNILLRSRLLPGIPSKAHLVEFHKAAKNHDRIELKICGATPDIPYGKDFRIQAQIVFEALPGGEACKAEIRVGINFLREPFLITKSTFRWHSHHQ